MYNNVFDLQGTYTPLRNKQEYACFAVICDKQIWDLRKIW